jgi:hypothetical protein
LATAVNIKPLGAIAVAVTGQELKLRALFVSAQRFEHRQRLVIGKIAPVMRLPPAGREPLIIHGLPRGAHKPKRTR